MARVYLKGLPQLKAKLVRMRTETIDQVRAAMERAAGEITGMMRRLVPVHDGDLRDSIGWTWGEAPKGSVKVSHKIGTHTITIFAGNETAFYARWVEFGTRAHNVAKGSKKKSWTGTPIAHPGAAARPFFYVSYRAQKKQAKLMIRRAITSAVQKAIR